MVAHSFYPRAADCYYGDTQFYSSAADCYYGDTEFLF